MPHITANNIIPIWCEDIYYNIALQIDKPCDLMAFAGTTKGLRAIVHAIFKRSRLEVCVNLKTQDNTSYSTTNPNTVVNIGNTEYITFAEWCDKLYYNTNGMHSLQKVQYYKNIRGMMFVNAYITPVGKTLAFARCECGILTTNRIMFEVAKLDVIHNSTAPAFTSIYYPYQSHTFTSRRLIIDCRHMCSKCMYIAPHDRTTPIALNNYAKATLSTTLHLNGSKIIIRNNGWYTLIK